jgi:hypothetical protein
MMVRSHASCRLALASLIVALYATPTVYGIDWVCCGYCKPEPTGPNNNCYGYYPTMWRPWPPECHPCAAAVPIATPAPEAPAAKPASPDKTTKVLVGPTITPVSTTQSSAAKSIIVLPKTVDSTWTVVPSASSTPK